MRYGLLSLVLIPIGIFLYKLYESYEKEQHGTEARQESRFTGQNQTICVVCLTTLEGYRVTKLPCMHKYHTQCIKEVFDHEVYRSCPHCRKHVPSTFKV